MSIASEIIGKLGGADVESVQVPSTTTNGSGQILYTVEVPPGEQVLVVFIGTFSSLPATVNNRALLEVGGSRSRADVTSMDAAAAAILTQTGAITMSGTSGVTSSTLSGGTVYTVKL